ncbi:MAG: CvpA family protein [Acidobacteriota bacterium]
MTVVDWVLLVVWVGLALGGFWKGAVRIIFTGGGLVVGVWLAAVAGDDAQVALEGVMGVPWLSAILGRLLLVVLCAGLALLAGWGIERTLTAMRLGWLNRLLGAVLAAVVAAVLLGMLVVVAIQVSPELATLCRESQVAQYLLWVSESLLGAAESL